MIKGCNSPWIPQATFLFYNCVYAVCNVPWSGEVGFWTVGRWDFGLWGGGIDISGFSKCFLEGGGEDHFFLGKLEGCILYSVEVGGGS